MGELRFIVVESSGGKRGEGGMKKSEGRVSIGLIALCLVLIS